jgi:alkanesulfonate monooxygenase SsuD/methylene tetrahydromethanopterin reductase-like flavin-dependent oxidoreductase (luciferase family)
MEIGYFTMPLHPPGSNIAKTLKEDLEQIVLLDGLGYKEAWIGEHFTAEWENIPAPDLFIAQALAMTENIVLGTGVTCIA